MDPSRIQAVPLFATLSQDELETVARVATELEVEAGTALTTEGEFGHVMYCIEEGTADVSSEGTVVRSVGPGDVVGEIAVIASGRRTATVVATSPMRLISVFKRDVWALERTSPETAERLRDLLGAHLGAPRQRS
jgi:CRP-like cAMP-binding protein